MTTNTLNFSVTSDSGSTPISGSQQESGGTEIGINQAYPAASSNVLLSIVFPTAGLQSIVLFSKKNMTILVNSTSSPILTINLVAGDPYIWQRSSGYFANPFSADVTACYVSCTAAATLLGKILKA